jgi:DNA repair protein RadA/Sms
MAKVKSVYVCQSCAAHYPKWAGHCSACGTWNSLVEEDAIRPEIEAPTRYQGYAGAKPSEPILLSAVLLGEEARLLSGLEELDLVLGGGLVAGSVVLIGGDPGIGKSTLLLQTTANLSQQIPVLYITGEESLQQVTLRARRLGVNENQLLLLAETQVERMQMLAQKIQPRVMVIDSIQTVYTESLSSAPGSVGQVRESAAQLVRYAKQTGTILFLVGHVTKEGTLAGPRVLEHMVDTVLYFEGEQDSRYRVVRAVKNRFGAVNELGVFAMTDKGLRGINNPSAIFLSHYEREVAGSSVLVTWEGSRPLLVEVQALVDESHMSNPRRVTVGLDQNRLAMLLAILHRHGGIATFNQDVFVNVVGGMKVTETAADLAVLLAVISSLRDRPIAPDWVFFGEVGLAGEIRPVQSGQERLREAAKLGFKRAIIPKGNAPKKTLADIDIIAVDRLQDALDVI